MTTRLLRRITISARTTRGALARMAIACLVAAAGLAADGLAAEPPFDINAPRPIGPRPAPRQTPALAADIAGRRRSRRSVRRCLPGHRERPRSGRARGRSRLLGLAVHHRVANPPAKASHPPTNSLTRRSPSACCHGGTSHRENCRARGSPSRDAMGRPLARSRGVPTETFRVRRSGRLEPVPSSTPARIGEVRRAVAAELNRRGFISVFARPAEDRQMHAKLRATDLLRRAPLATCVWSSGPAASGEVRTVASGVQRLAQGHRGGRRPRRQTRPTACTNAEFVSRAPSRPTIWSVAT
jgi:hypothetical protein